MSHMKATTRSRETSRTHCTLTRTLHLQGTLPPQRAPIAHLKSTFQSRSHAYASTNACRRVPTVQRTKRANVRSEIVLGWRGNWHPTTSIGWKTLAGGSIFNIIANFPQIADAGNQPECQSRSVKIPFKLSLLVAFVCLRWGKQ